MLQSCCTHATSVGMENAAETTAQLISRKSHGRSRVGNGAKLLPATDGRSMTARRFKDLVMDISLDLGGLDILSEAQKQLIRRAAMLSAECERHEALSARGEKEFNIELYVVMTNALRRVLETVGLRRVARDVSPQLEDYLSARTELEKGDAE